MTLKEKLNDIIITNINIVESENRMYYEYNHLELAESCEVIADEFAIGFADWVNGEAEYLDCNEKGTAYLYKHNRYRTSELLEIYKKEKGL